MDQKIDAKGFDEKSYYRANCHCPVKGKNAHHYDENIRHQQCLADADAGVFFDDQRNDIRSAGAGIHREQNGAANRNDHCTQKKRNKYSLLFEYKK